MKKRTTSHESIALLDALLQLAQIQCSADLGHLAGRLGWGVGRVVRVLDHLASKGLVDRQGVRLTLAGLAVVSSLVSARVGITSAA